MPSWPSVVNSPSSSPASLVSRNSQSAVLPVEAARRSSVEDGRKSRSLPCSPNVSGRGVFGSPTNAQQVAALDQFLSRMEAFRQGNLHELTALLQEASTLQTMALQATTATLERDAIEKVEACYERAGRMAMAASQHLQDLASEANAANATGGSAADLRRQTLAGTSAKLQQAVGDLFQAQRRFRSDMQAKSQRQLRIAFQGASEETMAAVAAASRSAASTIQESISLQSGTGPLETRAALMRSQEDLDALQDLADSARMLKQAFTEVELLVATQGETLNDIALQVAKARDSTTIGAEQLLRANRMQARMRKQQIICCFIMLLLIGVAVAIFFVLRR